MWEWVAIPERQERSGQRASCRERFGRQLLHAPPGRSLLDRSLATSTEILFERSSFPGVSNTPEAPQGCIRTSRVALVVLQTVRQRFVELEPKMKEGAHFVGTRELRARASVRAERGLPGKLETGPHKRTGQKSSEEVASRHRVR